MLLNISTICKFKSWLKYSKVDKYSDKCKILKYLKF